MEITGRIGYLDLITLPGAHIPEQLTFDSNQVIGNIEYYKNLITEMGIDTVWINVGLWDGSDYYGPQTPLEEYAYNLDLIFQEFIGTGVRVVWCETSMTIFAWLNEYAFEANVLADELAHEYGIPIFQMYYLQQKHGWELSDGIHFTPEALELIIAEIETFILAL